MKSTTPRLALASAVALLAALPSVSAADYTWNLSTGGVWDTTTANWTGAGSTWVNGSDNTASFPTFDSTSQIYLGTNIVAGTLQTNGGSTVHIRGGDNNYTLDVTTITTAGSSGGSIDMYARLTGNHGFTLHSAGTGRLNLKTAADYTGDTLLTGSAYLLIDGAGNNLLPTATNVTLNTGTTLRFGLNGNASHQIVSLSGAGTILSQGGTADNVRTHTLVINTSSANTGEKRFTGTLNNTTSILALEIAGTGTQIISGSAKNYSGATTISGGTLVLGANLTNTSSVTISGGTLASEGVASRQLGAGAVTLTSGSIRPGTFGHAGKFTVAANQDFIATGGILFFDLGSGAADTFDQILGSGTGTFSLANATLALNLLSGFDYGTSYSIFQSFAGGSVSNLSITGYDTSTWLASLSNAGVLSFAAIPEPSSLAALAGLGMLGLAVVRRRRA